MKAFVCHPIHLSSYFLKVKKKKTEFALVKLLDGIAQQITELWLSLFIIFM